MSSQQLITHMNATLNPGEHILSMLSRHHKFSGYRTYKRALAPLSNDIKRQYPSAVYRPIYRDAFNVATTGTDYVKFLKAHTLLNWYLPFMPEQYQNLDSEEVVFPHFYYRFHATHDWRYCLNCMEDDLETCGAPYYHLEHQLPLQSECGVHNEKLYSGCHRCHVSWKNVDRLGFPTGKECRVCEQALFPVDQFMDDDLRWLQNTSRDLLASNVTAFKLEQLQSAYQKALGLKSPNPKLSLSDKNKLKSLQFDLDNFFDPCLYHTIFNNCEQKSGYKKTSSLHLYQVVFHKDKFFAPIVHLLIIRMLFGELENIPLQW